MGKGNGFISCSKTSFLVQISKLLTVVCGGLACLGFRSFVTPACVLPRGLPVNLSQQSHGFVGLRH